MTTGVFSSSPHAEARNEQSCLLNKNQATEVKTQIALHTQYNPLKCVVKPNSMHTQALAQ